MSYSITAVTNYSTSPLKKRGNGLEGSFSHCQGGDYLALVRDLRQPPPVLDGANDWPNRAPLPGRFCFAELCTGLITFSLDMYEVIELKQDAYLQGLMQGEVTAEKKRTADNQAWTAIVTNLRLLCEEYVLPQEKIDACWPEDYGAIYERASKDSA